MATQGVGTYKLNAFWESGRLIYYEKASGHTTTGNTFILGHDYVQVGDTANDVDLNWYGTTTGTFILDAAAHTLAMTGMATSTDGAVTITNATATSSTTTGALIVTGGIATAADIYVGDDITVFDDILLSATSVINWGAGDVTITGGAGTLAFAGASSGISFDGPVTSTSTLGLTVATGALTATCGTLTSTAGRIATLKGTMATPAMEDGYGVVEIETTVSGIATGQHSPLSSWVNITGSGAIGSNIVSAQQNGIYADAGGNTGSTVIFGMRAQGILTDAPTVFAPFSLNTSNRAITALFHMTSNPDVGYLANAGTSGGKVGDVPLFCDAAGQQYFVRIYSARG